MRLRFLPLICVYHVQLGGQRVVTYAPRTDLVWHQDELPYHANAMRLWAFDDKGDPLAENVYYSVGGGFVQDDETMNSSVRMLCCTRWFVHCSL